MPEPEPNPEGAKEVNLEDSVSKTDHTDAIKLKDDALEFADEYRLREIIKKHSDYISYPIFVGEDQEQTNRQNAIWRESPREVKEEQYVDFYRQLTLELEPPLETIHKLGFMQMFIVMNVVDKFVQYVDVVIMKIVNHHAVLRWKGFTNEKSSI